MRNLLLSLAAFAVLVGGFAVTTATSPEASAATPTPTPKPAPHREYDLRVGLACSPLTTSQLAKTGDLQSCRIRIQNWANVPITSIVVNRPTPNTLTARYQLLWYLKNGTPYNPLFGPVITCDLSGCGPFTLAPGKSILIYETSTFNPYQDGRGKTTATVTGLKGGVTVTSSGTEQSSLP